MCLFWSHTPCFCLIRTVQRRNGCGSTPINGAIDVICSVEISYAGQSRSKTRLSSSYAACKRHNHLAIVILNREWERNEVPGSKISRVLQQRPSRWRAEPKD